MTVDMTITLERCAPSAHCYQCGSIDFVAVCDQCGRRMCGECGVVSQVSRGSTEFSDLKLDTVKAWHCEDHDHTVDGGLRWLMILGGIAVAAGVITVFGTWWVGVGLIALGGGGAGTGYWVGRRRRR